MKLIQYEIQKGDTLESIAGKHEITLQELVNSHNQNCGMTNVIIGNILPIHLNYIFFEKKNEDEKESTLAATEGREFEQRVSYRCEQLNITRIEEDVKSYSQLKKEYEVRYNLNDHLVAVKLCDFFYEFNPPALSRVFDFVSEVDYIRNNCLVKINELGRFYKILNKNEMKAEWERFKNEKLNDIEFIKVIKETKPQEYDRLLKEGDFQFSNEYNDEKDYNRDLFYLTILDKFLYKNEGELDHELYDYQSQLFPDVIVPMNVRYDVIQQDGDLITIRKVWETIESQDLLQKVNLGYEKYHRPLIKYKFSSYKLDMRNLFTYNVKTKLLEKAELSIIENIENNIKSECIFKIKKI